MEKKEYTTPVLTVVSFTIENAFVLSNNNVGMIPLESDLITHNSQGQQNWTQNNRFGNTDWSW